MNVTELVGALAPVFFVLALGYLAGKRNAVEKAAVDAGQDRYAHIELRRLRSVADRLRLQAGEFEPQRRRGLCGECRLDQGRPACRALRVHGVDDTSQGDLIVAQRVLDDATRNALKTAYGT